MLTMCTKNVNILKVDASRTLEDMYMSNEKLHALTNNTM